MKFSIRSRNVDLSDAERTAIIRRSQFALARLTGAVRRVDVNVVDVNGPRGGDDKLCRVSIRGPGLPPVVVEQHGADVLGTLADVVERAARATHRALDRRRVFTRAVFA